MTAAEIFRSLVDYYLPEPEPEPVKLFILTYTTRQRDRGVGDAYTSRADVEAACDAKMLEPEIDESYFVIRELKLDQGNP